jgi:hypothetical protein
MLAARRHILFYPTWIFRHSIAGVMSLQALSTEVDALIFGYLDKADKSRLMRVSKAYYETGKPLLYSEIRLRNDQDDKIKLLLVTFLERPKLPKHVLSFHLEPTTGYPHSDAFNDVFYRTSELLDVRDDPGKHNVCERLMSCTELFKKAIEHVSCGRLTTRGRMHWLSRAFQTSREYDGALALILCLSTQLRNLTLSRPEGCDLLVTSEIMQGSCAPTNTGGVSPLFAKLSKLRTIGFAPTNFITFDSEIDATVTTGLKELYMENTHHLGKLIVPHASLPLKSHLRKLALHKVDMTLAAFKGILSSHWMETLHIMHVTEPTISQRAERVADFSSLKETMLAHVPALREFVWTGPTKLGFENRYTPFGSLKDFKHLEILRIDCEIFAGDQDHIDTELGFTSHQISSSLSKFVNSFPSGLKLLELHGLRYDVLRAFLVGWDFENSDPLTSHDAMRNIRQSLPKLEKIMFIINMIPSSFYNTSHDPEQYEHSIRWVLDDLRLLADEMASSGAKLEAWCWRNRKISKFLLVGHGYTAKRIYDRLDYY